MGTINNFEPIFFYLTLGKFAMGEAFDGLSPLQVENLTKKLDKKE